MFNTPLLLFTNSIFWHTQAVGKAVVLVLPNSRWVKLSEKAPNVKFVRPVPQVPKVVALILLDNVITPFTSNFLNVNPRYLALQYGAS